MKLPKIDIVIISYAKNDECYELTQKCLDSLISSEEDANNIFNIIVVESQEDCNWDHYKNTKTYFPEKPYGYHKFLNFGRKKGSNELVALCNNDLEFHKGWFTEIVKSMERNPNALSFSPVCPLTQKLYGILPNTGDLMGYEIRKQLSGWCIIQKREIYETIGDLDERFFHWFCDNDYAMTLHKNGIEHFLVTSSLVTHHDKNIGKTTEKVVETRDEMWKLTNGSAPIFYEKWKK